MSDHIPDTGKMVPDAWVDAALDAYSDNEWRTSVSAMRAALAAVAPLIAAQERERCAAMVEVRGCHADPCCDDIACIATAIRALGDAT